MAKDNDLETVTQQLAKTNVGDKIVDFSGQGLKLDKGEDGK